jgi:choline dehydrogenase
VRKLRIEGKLVQGVEFFQGNEETFAEARRETILSAGAIGSPQILQLSGIGPGALLQKHGIPVAHELPVGENLQDHLQLRMSFRVKNALTLNTVLHSWWEKAKIGLEYAFLRSGPMTMPPSQLGAFVKSNPSHATPNVQYHVQPISLDKFGDPPHRFPAFTASACNLRPTSRGHVRITSPDPRAHPAIQCNYLSTPEDRQVAVESIRLTRRIVTGAEALRRYEPQEFVPGPQFQTDEELIKAAGNIGTTIFHPVGTCKMGRPDDPSAVVNPTLRVRGIARLRVIDASIMPTITSGNTNSPTLMVAERGAEIVLSGK